MKLTESPGSTTSKGGQVFPQPLRVRASVYWMYAMCLCVFVSVYVCICKCACTCAQY